MLKLGFPLFQLFLEHVRNCTLHLKGQDFWFCAKLILRLIPKVGIEQKIAAEQRFDVSIQKYNF